MDVIRVSDSNKELNQLLIETHDVKLRDRILLSPYTKFLLPSILFAFVVPVTVYAVMVSDYLADSSFSVATCNLRLEYQVDCLPGRNATREQCAAALCCWNEDLSTCYHTVPAQHGYTPSGGIYYHGVPLVPRETRSPLGSSNIEEIHLDVTGVDDNHLKISIAIGSNEASSRRRRRIIREEELLVEDEVTKSLLNFLPRDRRRRTIQIELEGSPSLNAYVHYPEFSVTVARNNSTSNEGGSSILSTSRGPFIFTETYWEWTIYTSENSSIYGLNDMRLNGTNNIIYNNENGTITPAFIAVSENGEGAAYYVDYKGPLEVQVLNVSNLVILRGMALPDNLAIHVFAGPTILAAVQQLTAAFSSYTYPPPRNYGLHVCPNETLTSVEEAFLKLNETVESLALISAPWDSHCLNERLASSINRVFTPEELGHLNEAIELLEGGGRSFIPHLSPMILADGGSAHLDFERAAVLHSNGSNAYIGLYHNASVVYPFWDAPVTGSLGITNLEIYLNETGSPASLWIRDAWPKDELNSSSRGEVDLTVFDYMPKGLDLAMNNRTLPYDLLTPTGKYHYSLHNNYSQGFRNFVRTVVPTVEFLGPPGEATNTSWSGLRRAVRSSVGAGIVGQLPPPMYVCGTGNFENLIDEQLCIRWYQAAVACPYVVALPDRLPGSSLLSKTASLTIVRILKLRTSLATYQDTVVANHFRRSSPVLAPTWLYYPDDKSLMNAVDQFMWGEALLVGLVTLPGVSQVPIRLPGDLPWRHLMGGAEAVPIKNSTTVVTATMGQLITLVRPGRIVPIHKDVGKTTGETMLGNVTLAVNLNCEYECRASGEIFYGRSSGAFLSIEINLTNLVFHNLESTKIYACYDEYKIAQSTYIETVEILGNTSYAVNLELCDFEGNTFSISLT